MTTEPTIVDKTAETMAMLDAGDGCALDEAQMLGEDHGSEPEPEPEPEPAANFADRLKEFAAMNGNMIDAIFDDVDNLAVLKRGEAARLWSFLAEQKVSEVIQDELRKAIGEAKKRKTNKAEEKVSERIRRDLTAWGYADCRLNLADGQVYHAGEAWSDPDLAKLRVTARDHGYGYGKFTLSALVDTWLVVAQENKYHPVRDYLLGLKWDGQNHIRTLGAMVKDSDAKVKYAGGIEAGWFASCLYRYLVAAAGKALSGETPLKVQSPMLTLVGQQSIGKSTLARWFCHKLPGAFREGTLDPDNADHLRALTKTFIWEIPELDSVTRGKDAASLRSILTQSEVTSRWPYAHFDTQKPACTSFIGTANRSAGVLADETGSRRFLVCNVTEIDQRYQQIDVDQVWAQAVAIWQRDPNEANLNAAEIEARTEVNSQATIEFPFEGLLQEILNFSKEWEKTTAEIVRSIQATGATWNESYHGTLARTLTHLGCERTVTKTGGTRVRGWKFTPPTQPTQPPDTPAV